MPETAPYAFYRPALMARAQLQSRDRVVALRNERGETVDELAVIAGEYLVVDQAGAATMSPAEFTASHEAYPDGGPLSWIRKAPPVRLAQPLDGQEAESFARSHFRCASDGTLICPLDAALSYQASQVLQAADKAAAGEHMAVLRALHGRLNAGPIYAPEMQGDSFMFDLVTAGLEAAPERPEDIAPGITPEDVPQIAEESCQTAGLPPLHWMPLGAALNPRMPQMRAVANHLFADLTEVPLERIQMSAEPAMAETGPVTEFAEFLRRTAEARPLEHAPDFSNLAPGYEPRVERYARDGIEYLVVEDFMGQFVYGWPDSAPVHVPGPAAP